MTLTGNTKVYLLLFQILTNLPPLTNVPHMPNVRDYFFFWLFFFFFFTFEFITVYFTQNIYLCFHRCSHLNIPLKIFPSKSQMWEQDTHTCLYSVYIYIGEMMLSISCFLFSRFSYYFLLFFSPQIPSFDANPLPSQDPLQQDQPTQTSQVPINILHQMQKCFNKNCAANYI